MAVLLLIITSASLVAADRTWDGGGGDNNWTTAANWDGDVTAPSAGDNLIFTGNTRTSPSNDFTADTSFGNITFSTGAGGFTLSGNRIVVTGSITNNDDTTQNINLAMIIGATRTIDCASEGISIGGVISGAGGLNKIGGFSATLSGANTYTGNTAINAAALHLAHNTAAGNGGTVTVANVAGARVNLSANGITVANPLVINGGTLATNGALGFSNTGTGTWSGPITINANTLAGGHFAATSTGTLAITGAITSPAIRVVFRIGNISLPNAAGHSFVDGAITAATVTLGADNVLPVGSTLDLGQSGVSILDLAGHHQTLTALTKNTNAGTVTSSSGTPTLTLNVGGTITYAGTLAGSLALAKTGAGTVTLSGTNTHSGGTVITAGTLSYGADTVFSGTGAIRLNGGKLLHAGQSVLANAFSVTASSTLESDDGDDFTLTGSTISATPGTLLSLVTTGGTAAATHGFILQGTGTFTYAGDIGMDAFSRLKFDNASGTQTFSGVISGTVGAGNIAVWRASTGSTATTVLSGANTYSGLTLVEYGTLTSGAAGVIPDASVMMVRTGATWNLNGFNETVGSLSDPNTSNPTVATAGGSIALGSATLTTGGLNASPTFSGVISGTGGLVKNGTGTLTFGGTQANTYSGTTTVANGTLHLNRTAGINAVAGPLALTGGTVTFGAHNQIADTVAVTMSSATSVLNGTGVNAGQLVGINETFASLTMTGGCINQATSSTWNITGAWTVTGGVGNTIVLGNSGSHTTVGSLSLTAMTAIAGGTTATANSFTLYGNNATQSILTIGSGGLTLNGSVLNMRRGASGMAGSKLVLAGNITTTGGDSAIAEDTAGGTAGTCHIELSGAAGAVTRTVTTATSTSLTISLPITDGAATPGSLTKSGAGVLTLSGASTYTGTTTLIDGTLRVSADVITSTDGALGNAASAVVLAGGTFDSNTTTVSRPLVVNGYATIVASGAARTVSAPISVAPGVRTSVFSTSLRAITQNDWRLTQTITGTRFDTVIDQEQSYFGTAGERAAYGIAGNDGDWNTFSMQWDGYLHVVTAGTNLYTRSDDSSRLWLDLNHNDVVDGGEWGSNGWGTGQGPTSALVHASLPIGIYRMRVQFEEDGGGNEMFLLWNDAAHAARGFAGLYVVPSTMLGGLLVGDSGPDLTLSGVISGSGSVIKPGGNVVTVSGANSYTGRTAVNAGTLRSAATGVIPDLSAVTVASGATWNADGFSEVVGSLAGAGSITLGSAALTAGGDDTSTTFSGVISGTGSVSKAGSGTWALSGASTYSGLSTMLNGTLRVDADVIASTNGPLGNAASAIVLAGGTFASNTAVVSRAMSVTGGVTLEAYGIARTVASAITLVPGVEPFVSSFIPVSLRGVLEDDWRTTRTITGTRVDADLAGLGSAFGTPTERAAFGIGGSDGNWEQFSVQWDGWLRVVTAGTDLYTWSDDGSRVWLDLDGDNVIDSGEWGSNGWGSGHGAISALVHAGLPIGTYRVRIQYEDGDGDNRMALTWNDAAHSGGSIDGRFLVPSAFVSGFAVGGAGQDLTLTGVVSGPGGMTKSGVNVVTMSGANTYGGVTPVAAGTLRLGANDSLPNTRVHIYTGAVFDAATYSDAIGSLIGSGSVTLGAAGVLSTGNDNSSSTYSGVVSGAGALIKAGSGIFTLTGANTYDGTTTVSVGGLTISHATGLGSTTGGTTVASGANLTIAGVTVGAEALNLSGTGIASAGALVGSGTAALGGAVTLAADASISTSGTFSLTSAVGETGGVRTLTKLGTGTVIVAGANTYTGATNVNAGTLLVNGNSAVANGAVGVASGTTIGGTGTIGGVVTVSSGGTFAPGSNSAATTTIAAAGTALNLSAGSTSAFTLGTASDQIICSGASSVITLGGTLAITDGGGLAPGTYTLMTFIGSTTSGTFSSVTVPTGFTGVVSIDNVTTHSVILTVDVVNTGLTVAPGGAAVAMTSNLSAAQSGSSTAQIVYTLTTPPLHGSLRKNLVLLGTNDTFTQADIDNNLVSYEHGDLAQTSDSFQVDIAGLGGAIATRIVAVTVSGTGLANSLMAYLPFEQTSGTVAPDVAGTYTGTVGGTPAWSAGQIGHALTFNGSSTFVQLPSGMADFTGGLTISVWARPTANNNFERFVEFGNGGGSNNLLFSRAGTGSDLTFQIFTGGNQSAVTDGVAITNNSWHHYLVTSTPGGSNQRFKDGTPINSTVALTTIPNVTRTVNYIGRSNWVGDGLYQGQLDEVRVYNRPLNAGEVKLLSQQAAPSFGSLSGDNVVYAGTGSPVALDVGGNATVSDADDLHFSTGYLLIANHNAFATSALSVATAGGITTSGATVSFGGNVIGTIDGTLNGASGAHLKIAFTTQHATSTAVQDLVRAVRFSDTVTVQRTFSVTLSDGVLAPVPATVTMTASSALSVTTNTGLNLAAGGVGAFSAAHLTATSTVGQTAAQITYTLTTAPTHGVLRNNLIAIAASGTFTQANIDSGLISYEHGNLSSLSDSFQVTVSDALSNNGGQSLVTVTATGTGLGSGLVGYWPFDDGSGTSAVDRSGSKYHATLFNTPTWAAGQLGSALTFNGSTQYGSIPRPVQDDFTIITWFKSTAIGVGNSGSPWTGASGLIDGEVGGVVNDFGLAYAGAGYVVAGVGNIDTSARQSSSYNDNVWHQASFTRSRNGQNIALRVDNNTAVSALTNGNALTAPSVLNFARLQTGMHYFDGSLDDVRIYDRVLTSDELTAIYQATTNAPPAFANLNGDSVLVTAANTAFAIDSGTAASVSDSDDLCFSGGYVLVENVTGGTTTTLSIATVGLITTSGATVRYNGNAIGTIDGTLGGSAGASLKVLFTTTAATPTAVSALIQALRYANTTAVPDHTLRITLSDGLLTSSATTTAYGGLFLTANTGVTVASGAMVTLDATALAAAQSSATSAQVVYTVTTLPTHGYLRKNRAALAVNDTFTQADIANNLVSFEHGDLAFTSDSFQVTIAGTQSAAIGTTTVAITVAGSGLALNLQARWRLDDGSGTTVSDATGNGNTGTAGGTTWIPGRLNGGLTFASPSQVTAGNAAALRPAAAISVSGWFRTGNTGNMSIIRHDLHFTPLQATGGTTAQVALWPGGVLQTYEFPWDGVWTDDNWHHYAVSYHQTNGLRIYFDGALTHSTGTFTGALDTSTTKPFIMGAAENGAEYYDGDLDEVRFYDRVLAGGEVRLLAEQAVPLLANLDGDVANYTEDAAAIAIDSGSTAAFSDSDDLTLAGGYLLVDNVTASTGAAISIATTASITTSGATVSHDGNAIGTIDSTFNGTGGVDLRINFSTDEASPAAVTALIQALRYQDLQGPSGARVVGVSVNDGVFTSATATVTITVTSVNDTPVVAANTGLTVASGKVVAVTPTNLLVTDQDNTAAQLTYTVTAIPAHGYLRKDLVAMAANDTFTQEDIANQRISYEHGTLAQTSDGFTFTLTDGVGGNLGATSVTITVAGTGLLNGLVAYWKLDETSGTSAVDATGNGHVGTHINGPTPATGRLNGDLSFNRAALQSVTVAYDAQFALSTYTVSALIKPTSTANENGIFGTRTGADHTFDLKWEANRIHGDIGNGATWLSTAADIGSGQGGTLSNGTWYLVTYVIDNANQHARLYLDGSLRATVLFAGTPLLMSPGQTMTIGSSGGAPGVPGNEHAHGEIDDVRIYGRALSGSEVQTLWQHAMPVIANLDGDAPTYAEGAAAVALDTGTAAAVSDSDDLTLAGGYLLVENTTGSVTDTLSVANIGSGAGQIGVSGSTISFQGAVIGTIDGTDDGATGADLRIGFTTDDATPAALSALVHALRFADSSQTPSATSRVLRVTVSDNQYISAVATVTLAMSSVPDVLSRITVDADGDGHLDAIRLTFDQALNDDFSAITITVAGYTAGTPVSGAVANDAIIEVPLTELVAGDTGATPAVRITVNTSLAGTATSTLIPVEGSATTATDVAAPVLLSTAWTDAGTGGVSAGDTVTLTFSESVTATSMVVADLGLPVSGDTLSGTTIADQTNSVLTMTLAGTPQLTPGQAYSSAALTVGRPTGVFIADPSVISDAVALNPATGNAASARDLGSNDLLSIEWIIGTNPKAWVLGAVALGHTANTASAGLDLSLRNVGASTVNLAIAVSTSAPSGWAPAAAAGTDAFLLKVDNASLPAGDPTDPAAYELTLSTTGQSLVANLLSGVATDLELFIGLPTAITSGGGIQQTTTVTITATLPP